MLPLATWRAHEVAFQMGVRDQGSYRGKVVRLIGESLCWVIGQFVKEQDWWTLYELGGKKN